LRGAKLMAAGQRISVGRTYTNLGEIGGALNVTKRICTQTKVPKLWRNTLRAKKRGSSIKAKTGCVQGNGSRLRGE